MTTKADMIAAIQAIADAKLADTSLDANQRKAVALALGSPGQRIEIAGTFADSNAAFTPEPKVMSTLVEGIASWADAQGIAGIAGIKGKLNELILQYNQLLADHNAGVVPSSATPVTVLP